MSDDGGRHLEPFCRDCVNWRKNVERMKKEIESRDAELVHLISEVTRLNKRIPESFSLGLSDAVDHLETMARVYAKKNGTYAALLWDAAKAISKIIPKGDS